VSARAPRDSGPGRSEAADEEQLGADPPTDERPYSDPLSPDPFSLDDPEARAREERRLERERRRLEREQRRQPGDGAGGESAEEFFDGRRGAGGDGMPAPTPTDGHPDTQLETVRDASPPSAVAIHRRRMIAIVALAVAALVLWFLYALFQPFGGDGDDKVVVKIPKGASAEQVGEMLEKRGVISGGTPLVSGSSMFKLRLSLAGKSEDIPAGTYTLASGMSYGAAIDELTASPSERGVTVVIPEGYTRDQIAKIADDAGLQGNYKKATLSSNQINLKRYGAQGANSLEGFLFPATYELDPKASADDLVAQHLNEFERNFKQVDLDYARSKNLTPYDVLIIASLIDREVQVPRERKLVAEVIYNRLAADEPLAIDATIRYATGNYDEQLTDSELAIDSPYNTRLVAGLPPTPIGNPGLGAIEAAADPGRGDRRFFVVKPGTCGKHVFTASEQEFNQAAARYQRALEREGGSPTEC
jgi:UPF0755 protein